MEYVIIAGVIVLLAVLYSRRVVAKRRPWVIRLRAGVPFLVKGKVSQTVVAELADVLQRHGVRRGAIYGLDRRGTVALGFSRHIPQSARQALRNVWSMHAR